MTIFICWDASYAGYKKISNKARCSMSPRNCPYEVNQVVRLNGGINKTIYYCTFQPDKVTHTEPHEQQQPVTKTSCRLSGG